MIVDCFKLQKLGKPSPCRDSARPRVCSPVCSRLWAVSEVPCHLVTCRSTEAGTWIVHPGGRGDRGDQRGGMAEGPAGVSTAALVSSALCFLWGVLWHGDVEAFEFREGA